LENFGEEQMGLGSGMVLNVIGEGQRKSMLVFYKMARSLAVQWDGESEWQPG
jgi:hypothetical protein